MAVSREELIQQIEQAGTLEQLELVKIQLLGRKGVITEQLRAVGSLPEASRAAAGQSANLLRAELEKAIGEKGTALRDAVVSAEFSRPFDLTAPGKMLSTGHRHPVSLVLDELIDIYWQMGYQVAEVAIIQRVICRIRFTWKKHIFLAPILRLFRFAT
jgi:phenylalanyl-tRNA synthetase alpha chain